MRAFQKSYLKKTTEVNGDPKNGRFVVYADCLPMTLRGMKWRGVFLSTPLGFPV